jgi:hypothetical protein
VPANLRESRTRRCQRIGWSQLLPGGSIYGECQAAQLVEAVDGRLTSDLRCGEEAPFALAVRDDRPIPCFHRYPGSVSMHERDDDSTSAVEIDEPSHREYPAAGERSLVARSALAKISVRAGVGEEASWLVGHIDEESARTYAIVDAPVEPPASVKTIRHEHEARTRWTGRSNRGKHRGEDGIVPYIRGKGHVRRRRRQNFIARLGGGGLGWWTCRCRV